MWDSMVCKYNIRTSSHYNKIFLLCHLTDQITLIEENSILNWKSMIFLEILHDGRVHVAELAAVALVKDDDHMLLIKSGP